MEINIKGLVAAGHEMTSELKAECGAVDMRSVAKLISDLATQLEVQLVRANALAAENAGLKSGAMDEIKVINRGGQAYCVKDGVRVNPMYARGGMTIAQSLCNQTPQPPMLSWLKFVHRGLRCLLTICCVQTLMALSVTLLPSFAKEEGKNDNHKTTSRRNHIAH